jgi:hypothetical protein
MSDVAQLLEAIGRGEPQQAQELLPIVYEVLRRLAEARLAREPAGQTTRSAGMIQAGSPEGHGTSPKA